MFLLSEKKIEALKDFYRDKNVTLGMKWTEMNAKFKSDPFYSQCDDLEHLT